MNEIEVIAIEDSLPDAEIIRSMLRSAGEPAFSFSHAQRLSEGLAALSEKKYDVVLLDLGLPDSYGIDTVVQFRKEFPAVPIVVLTGVNDEEIAIKALQMDVQDYLVKGQIKPDLLARSILYSIERKRAVEALRASESRFRRLSESGIIGIAFFDTEGRINDANDKLLAMTGYTLDELQSGGLRWDRLTPPEWMPRTLEAMEELKATGKISQYQKEYFRKDGSRFWGLFGATRLEWQAGAIGFVLDITEQKNAEKKIRNAKVLSDDLNVINKLIHSTLDADSIMQNAIREASRAMHADSGAIGTLEEDSLVISYVNQMPRGFKDRCCLLEEVEGVRYVVETREAIAVNDTAADKRVNGEFWKKFGFVSLVLAPLIGRDEVTGILIFCSSKPSAFSDSHVDFAKKLSASLSLAVEKAKLFAEVREHQERESFLASAINNSAQPFTARYPDGRLMYYNKAFLELVGYTGDELRAITWKDLTPPEWRNHEKRAMQKLIRTGEPQLFEKEYFRKDGTRVPVEMKVHVMRDEAGRPGYYFAFVTDIADRKRKEEEMRRLALHDPLTGLPNRRLFIDIITVEREQARRDGKKMAILFLDLDRFKEVNDTLGHDAGDLLLKEAASRLRAEVRKADTIARIGGDEFNIILAGIARPEDTADIAQSIVESFKKPFKLFERELTVTISVGISIFPDDNEDIDLLLKYADLAMYQAKDAGRNNYQFYDQSMNALSLERLALESLLKRSIDSGEMRIYYQPLVDIATGRIVWAEALARLQHPEKGLLCPRDFLPAAEQTGFINKLDEWVLRTVTAKIKAWHDAGLPPVRVTMNVSAAHLHHPRLVEIVSELLKENGVSGDSLSFEISEKTAMADLEWTAGRLRQLANIGVHISIDDFGTGYSSLNHLERLPVERLKIDGSSIRDIPGDPDGRTIVRSVTALAHSMRMKVVAEGVETGDQLKFLKATGCDEMQGYLFSKPLPVEEFEELLAKKAA